MTLLSLQLPGVREGNSVIQFIVEQSQSSQPTNALQSFGHNVEEILKLNMKR